MKNQFKMFLITEERVYLGTKVGDILTALQQLRDDAGNMGKRHLMRLMKNIGKQIRRILHGSWTFEEESFLKELQKVGVAMMKGLDDNEDLPELVASCAAAVEKLSGQLDEPTNNLGAPAVNRMNTDEGDDDSDKKSD